MSFLQKWADGDYQVRLHAERKAHPAHHEHRAAEHSDRLDGFSRIYTVLVVLISIALLLSLVYMAVNMPTFGSPENPTVNEVPERYVSMAEEETGAENAIAGMILNYRGFDTFGESNVLFLAVCCVMLLLWNVDGPIVMPYHEHDAILNCVSKVLIPAVFMFGISVLLGGHVSPGGGFSGGSILGAALILYAVAFGAEAMHRFFTRRVFNIVRVTGLMIYACMFFIYIYQGANTGESALAHYIVLFIDIAVGLVVMSTMYGFYAFYTKGDL